MLEFIATASIPPAVLDFLRVSFCVMCAAAAATKAAERDAWAATAFFGLMLFTLSLLFREEIGGLVRAGLYYGPGYLLTGLLIWRGLTK
ncbi:MAG: hypothetical protein AAFM92_03290 [Pseudomonadota bacterium]